MKRRAGTMVVIAAGILALAVLSSCATVQVNPLPAPPPTAKLRVYVEAFTLGPVSMKWGTPHEEYAKNQIRRTSKFLEKKGIYEVVNPADVKAVIGERMLSYDLVKNNGWANARAIGKALHADFVLITARNKSNVGTGEWVYLFSTELVNVESGAAYRSQVSVNNIIGADTEFAVKLTRESYRELFNQAKHDMMALAVRKGRAYAPPAAPASVEAPEAPAVEKPFVPSAPQPSPVQPVTKQEGPLSKKEGPPAVAKTVPPSPALTGKGLFEEQRKDPGAKKLVVYDFHATDQYRTVALILVEALREEVFKLKQFVLVNREDLQQVLEEMALQQTGLIDEKEAVKTGRGLAASQVVTGQLGQLGKTFVMQAKRVDVETFGTLGLASIKFTEGAEDEALNRLPGFAKELVGLR